MQNKSKKSNKTGLSFIWRILAIIAVLLFLLFLFLPHFGGDKNNSSPKQTKAVTFNKEGNLWFINQSSKEEIKIDIEITDNRFEQVRGLMFRTSLPEMGGMLFIMDREEPQSFWMKNTYISLDIIYVDSRFEIVTIQKYTQPLSEESIPSGKIAKYVVEVNAGFCDRFGIMEGDKIKFNRV
ncbi:MAG TPA: DUF192 domain-containing protein [Bacteroidales bacterium]|nr:DUF192 domain-containing protein [Bacteroidales bacterium]